MKRHKNQQYAKIKLRTLQKIGQSKEAHLQAMRASQLAIQTVLGAMQMAVLLSAPKRIYDKGNVFTPANGIVGETGPEMLFKAEQDGEFRINLQKGDKIVRP